MKKKFENIHFLIFFNFAVFVIKESLKLNRSFRKKKTKKLMLLLTSVTLVTDGTIIVKMNN